MPRTKDPSLSGDELKRFQTLLPLLESMHSDIRELSRKNQNTPLSKSRIEIVNRLLTDTKTLLADEPTAQYLPTMDEATIPQNADALIILGQFMAAMDQFRKKYTYFDDDEELTFWRIRGGSDVVAEAGGPAR